jgi:hypothetical protein
MNRSITHEGSTVPIHAYLDGELEKTADLTEGGLVVSPCGVVEGTRSPELDSLRGVNGDGAVMVRE